MDRILVFGLCENFGGTESYVLTLYQSLDKRKVQFDFLFPQNTSRIPYQHIIEEQGGKIYREYRTLHDGGVYGWMEDFFDQHPEWTGVYINLQNINTAFRLLEIAKKKKLKYRIIHAHNSGRERKMNMKEKVYYKYFQIRKKNVVTSYLACSKQAGEWMYHQKDFDVIPNAVNFAKFQINNELRKSMRHLLGISDDTIVIGFCGRLCYQKDPIFLIQIFVELVKLNQNIILLVVGDGKLKEQLVKLAENLRLESKIIWIGSSDKPQDYMQAMDCLVLPSRFEGFGMVLLEAQAAGLRCYTSADTVPETTNITGRVQYINKSESPQEWAKEIMKVGFDRKDCMKELNNSEYTVDKLRDKFMTILGVDCPKTEKSKVKMVNVGRCTDNG